MALAKAWYVMGEIRSLGYFPSRTGRTGTFGIDTFLCT